MTRLSTLILALFCLNFSSISAQIPDGSIAPDFTATDIEGNEHNLYDLLSQGKTVIIDLFATWCGPCWAFHQTHTLADLYNDFGPDGTDELYIFGIEGDGRTNVDCLYGQTGCNDSSIGDWVTGVPYPTIDSRKIFEDFEAGYFPTVMMIYPDRTVHELRTERTYDQIVNRKNLGPKLSEGVNPSLLEVEVPSGSICFATNSDTRYLINNTGKETITSADISVSVNGTAVYEESWTGEVAPWGIITEVEVPGLEVSENSTIELRMDNINGDAANSFEHSSEVLLNVSNSITVTIITDAAASVDKNRFEMINIFGSTVASEELSEPNKEYVFNYALEELTCHIFTIYDSGDNGIDGKVEIKDDLGNIIFNNNDFGSAEEIVFNASQNTSVDNLLQDVSLSLAPNPVSETLFVNLNLESAKTMNLIITNLEGAVVSNQNLSLNKGETRLDINVNELSAGLYLININDGQGHLTSKFVKQ